MAAGHNDTLTDDQRRMLLINSLVKLERLQTQAKDIGGKVKQVRKELKADGFSKEQVNYALWLRREDTDPDTVREQREERERVAKWLARPEGFQGGLFDGPGDGVDRAPAVDRAYEAGKLAGLEGKSASPPHDASTPQGQSWLTGHADGQAVLAKGFKPLPPSEEEDDDDIRPRHMREKEKGMPSAGGKLN